MGKILAKEVTLYSTKEHYVFDNSINSKVLCFAFGLVAEIERNLIAARTKEALALRKQQGIKLGRPIGYTYKLNILRENENQIYEMLNNGIAKKGICKKFKVSRSTLYRFINESNNS